MIEDEDHPRMRKAEAELRTEILPRFVGKTISGSMLTALLTVLADHRTRWQQKGVGFPALTAFIVPRLGVLDLVNAELEGDALRLRVVAFARKHPQATPLEVAEAVKHAFPEYQGGKFEDVLAAFTTTTQ